MGKKFEIGCYYFPNYHMCDERNAMVHGEGWSEWELVKAAIPRYPGHYQPLKPVWGYTDESKPEVMRRKIAAAVNHGIDSFIFDYYHYADGTFLSHCLDDGFLPAVQGTGFKFGLMWANHNWIDIHPRSLWHQPEILYEGGVDESAFVKITDYVIEHYFRHPNYLLHDGKPFFSIYDLRTLLKGLGGFSSAKKALAGFRARTVAAGFPDLELNAIVWGSAVLPGEEGDIDLYAGVKELGFDTATSYCWLHHNALQYDRCETPYSVAMERYLAAWDEIGGRIPVPYYPNISVGWDSSPRCSVTDKWSWNLAYPYSPLIVDNTPENFRKALEIIRSRMEKNGAKRATVYCWNEWTEGSMLEPEERYGMGYLEAMRDVFGK